MTNDLEQRLRESLRRTALPTAPAELRDHLVRLPELEGPPRHRSTWGWRLVATVALVVMAVAAGTLVGGTIRPMTTAAPSATTAARSESAGPTSSPRFASPKAPGAGTFSAPGVTFAIPHGWTDQSSSVRYPDFGGSRFVVLLVRGMTMCPIFYDSTAAPTAQPDGCREQPDRTGTATLGITELRHQYPWDTWPGTAPVTDVSYPTWSYSQDPTHPTWLVRGPEDGIYVISLSTVSEDVDARTADAESVLRSLELSAWEPAPEVIDGRIRVAEPHYGFSFDYPAGWSIYYPQDQSMMDGAVVTVASNPLEPPCPDVCQRFTTPPGTIVIEFRVGSGPREPDWTKAPTTIGGQPAFGPQDWGHTNATSADEGHSWNARLPDRRQLGIHVSLAGPDLLGLRAAMDQVIDSVRITP
jgi:hypothetical protein